ncbi:hypothetical protein F5Y03DRAFT_258638 [Xylaria venustula]|nr:hypothetical protein F5Y03DRAFT_258638 [Xylaria venustula]
MSLSIALQSVVFYVVACTPCHQAIHQRQLKQQAKKHREQQLAERSQHGGYQQPEPFSTNPYWSEEIKMGPHIERKKYKTNSQRRLTSAGGDTVSVSGSSIVINHANSNTGTLSPSKENDKPNASIGQGSIISVTNIEVPSSINESGYQSSPEMTADLPHDWNHKLYQREDEELWGSDLSRTGHKLMDAIKHAGSSAGRFIESSLNKDTKLDDDDDEEGSRYFLPVNPPVNDYHPPIVRRTPLKGAIQWMVQPPPPAKLMEGKVPVSRGSSVASRRTANMDRYLDGTVPVSRGSSTSNLSRRTTRIDRIVDEVVPSSYGSSVSNLSSRVTSNDDRNTGGPVSAVEF